MLFRSCYYVIQGVIRMIQAEVYDRIELIYSVLQEKKDTLNEHLIELLYDELEILCEVILDDRMKPAL